MEPALSEPPPDPALPLEKAVLAVARCKAEEVAARHPHRLVVGADTIVVAEGKILGKPGSPEEAGRMLRLLAGRTHEVMTGVWICSPGLCGGFIRYRFGLLFSHDGGGNRGICGFRRAHG